MRSLYSSAVLTRDVWNKVQGGYVAYGKMNSKEWKKSQEKDIKTSFLDVEKVRMGGAHNILQYVKRRTASDFYQYQSSFSLAVPLITLCWLNPDLIGPGFNNFGLPLLSSINDVPHIPLVLHRNAKALQHQSAAHIHNGTASVQVTCFLPCLQSHMIMMSVQGNDTLQVTVAYQGTASIPKSPNDYTPTDASQTSRGDGTFRYICFEQGNAAVTPDMEIKSMITEEINIEEKESSNVERGETGRTGFGEQLKVLQYSSCLLFLDQDFEAFPGNPYNLTSPTQQSSQQLDPKDKGKEDLDSFKDFIPWIRERKILLKEKEAKRTLKEKESDNCEEQALKEA
ncbi:hypothetical protein Tco_0216403 [Tanacetum coccineum]